ncbi:hypothetical protein HY489_02530, partial [Candidatus Woesearchaeota archaeon]|nr:hypothetical protein [Candidatus Woesearchaeota archaeon]
MRETGERADLLRYRHALKQAGLHGPLDLSLRGGYAVSGETGFPAYGKGLNLLRTACKRDLREPDDDLAHPFYNGLPCPLLFSETLEAKLDCQDSVLWNNHFGTFSGVLYKGERPNEDDITEFKIVPLAVELLGLGDNAYVEVPFDRYGGEVFRTNQHRCNAVLSPEQASIHCPWLAAAGYNQDLLDRFVARAEREARQRGNDFSKYFMNFWVLGKRPEVDQLRPLVLLDGVDSIADGNDDVSNYGRFARVRPLSVRAGGEPLV